VTADPSKTSFYVTEAFYVDLMAAFTDWQTEAREVSDVALRDRCRMLLEKEARLLEQNRLEDWLALYTAECLYWIPGSAAGGDPRREVAVAFDDRRRIEDRIYRLRNDYAWSQRPASRTSRMVSNVSVFSCADRDELMLRSTFLITEFQAGITRRYAGWCGHRLRTRGKDWAIAVKQVNLIDCDQNLRNPSIIL
jgi:3-phenylpropionate/cinnamic acid dioxygenase small subunit